PVLTLARPARISAPAFTRGQLLILGDEMECRQVGVARSASAWFPPLMSAEDIRMAWRRYIFPALVGGLLVSSQLHAQGTTGIITGRVVDSASAQGIANVNVVIMGGQRGTLSREDGGFTLSNVPAGTYTVRASRI